MDNQLLQALKSILQEELQPIKSQLNENTQILKALEHRSQVHSAKFDKLEHDISRLQGDISKIKDKVDDLDTITVQNLKDIARLRAAK